MSDNPPANRRRVDNDNDRAPGQPRQQAGGAQPGDQQQALDAQTGGPRPEYDQYEVNQAGNINKQAEAQPGEVSSRPDRRAAADADRPLDKD